MESVQPPLSNVQLVLLQLFAKNISDEDINAIRRLIGNYLMDKALKRAEKISEERGYDEETIKKILNQD